MQVSVLSVPRRLFFIMCSLCLIASGCGSLLPSVRETTKTNQWESFEEAKTVFEQIIPYTTTSEDLKLLGFDPDKTSNLSILTHLDIIQSFMSNPSITKLDLDKGIQDCINAKTNCRAYEIKLKNISRKRHGNVLLDLLNFNRQTRESGWEFEALIVMVDGSVVYKHWKGRPIIDSNSEVRNPLGPLQDPSGVVKERATSQLP